MDMGVAFGGAFAIACAFVVTQGWKAGVVSDGAFCTKGHGVAIALVLATPLVDAAASHVDIGCGDCCICSADLVAKGDVGQP